MKATLLMFLAALAFSSASMAGPGPDHKQPHHKPPPPKAHHMPKHHPQKWDEKEYRWWQSNCIHIKIGNTSISTSCQKIDKRYRDHYNRSIHSGNNPGRGHDR